MKPLQLIYDRNKDIQSIMKKLGFSRTLNTELTSSRIIENIYVLRNIPSNGKILDVGSTGSIFPLILLGLGYEVWTIDIRKYELEYMSNNLHCIVGDIRKTKFPDSFFNIISAISTIEHIGLGRYGDPIDSEGDKKAMKEIRRLLTNEGILSMTVPFGKKSISKFHRVYDQESLFALLSNFHIENICYFIRTNRLWIKSQLKQIENIDSSINVKAIACVKAHIK